jgi:transcription antitermination factor NusG
MPWYVARVKLGRADAAMRGLDDQGFDPYYPIMTVTVARAGGRMVDRREPVFPSYLFVCSEPEPCQWRAMNGTRGVVRLLGHGPDGEPSALREGEVERLMERERKGQLCHPTRRQIRAGDRVEFKNGALVGLGGVCQWTRRERVAVLLSMFGGSRLVETPRDWLRVA